VSTAKYTSFTKVADLNRSLRYMPKLIADELRDTSGVIAGRVQSGAQGRAQQVGGVAALVAPTIRVARERVPVVRMGNRTTLPPRNGHPRRGKHQTIGDVIFGAEFGGGRPRTPQFDPWRGNDEGAGYFLWPTVRALGGYIHDEYSAALKAALRAIR
jgi:hypothetical protein